MRTTALIALIATVAIACAVPVGSAGPSASVGDTPSNSTPVSAEPSTPAPSTPASPGRAAPPGLVRVAVKERDDVRIEVELQRNPLQAGEPSWVKVRVTNEGRTVSPGSTTAVPSR